MEFLGSYFISGAVILGGFNNPYKHAIDGSGAVGKSDITLVLEASGDLALYEMGGRVFNLQFRAPINCIDYAVDAIVDR